MVRVRFAPSPTGYLHIGSARTALFNWLYAKHVGGNFVLRIEDTDRQRSNGEYLDEILGSLKWLFMDWDEEPVFQSRRLDLYKKYAERLVGEKKAHREGPAVIFDVERDRDVFFDDLIRGRITVSTNQIKDQVLIKSDLTPTYNFACVVDDAEMKITHVIRGDDHISNTPKQILLYEALGLAPPGFAHIPLILSKTGGRMSKRQGAASIFEYKTMGFLPEAMVNYLALLGWAPGDDREIMPVAEMVNRFDVKDVNTTPATFDMDKLSWMNGQYIKQMTPDALAARSEDFLKGKGVIDDKFDRRLWGGVIKAYRERIRTLDDLVSVYKIFFGTELEYDDKAVEKYLKRPGTRDAMNKCMTALSGLEGFDKAAIEAAYRSLADEMKVKAAELIHPTRVAISGKTVGAGLFEMMEMLGRDRVLARISKFC